MYYYVYDEFIQHPRYERELASIETKLTDLGVSGKIARLALFRDASELIRDEIKRGAKTIIAVGNDLTIRKVIDAASGLGAAIGIIPIGSSDQRIADLLGVPQGAKACELIAARNIEKIDMGMVNGHRFIHSAEIQYTQDLLIDVKGEFSLYPPDKRVVEIRNLAAADSEVMEANPTDGKLELVIRPAKQGWISKKPRLVTRLPFTEMRALSAGGTKIQVDGAWFEGSEFRFSVVKGNLHLIAGKDRKF